MPCSNSKVEPGKFPASLLMLLHASFLITFAKLSRAQGVWHDIFVLCVAPSLSHMVSQKQQNKAQWVVVLSCVSLDATESYKEGYSTCSVSLCLLNGQHVARDPNRTTLDHFTQYTGPR